MHNPSPHPVLRHSRRRNRVGELPRRLLLGADDNLKPVVLRIVPRNGALRGKRRERPAQNKAPRSRWLKLLFLASSLIASGLRSHCTLVSSVFPVASRILILYPVYFDRWITFSPPIFQLIF
jgi:hypothetical protein